MKQHKLKSVSRPLIRGASAKRQRAVRAARPLHKRVLLHPFTVMVLLCAGVLIIGSAWTGFAVSYTVTATVPAPPVTSAATIAAPTDGQHVAAPDITVSGGCAPQSYVTLSVDGSFAGSGPCGNYQYSLDTTLAAGPNQLVVQIYNLTNQAGPTTPGITVYYDAPAPPPSPNAPVPTEVTVDTVEGSTFAGAPSVPTTSENPTITGFAPPLSHVVVTFHSIVVTCETEADSKGYWSCTLPQSLPDGTHEVQIMATTPSGEQLTYPAFNILVKTPYINPAPARIHVDTTYRYQVSRPGQVVSCAVQLLGGTAPYTMRVDWGDHDVELIQVGNHDQFSLDHSYKASGNYTITLTVTDAAKASSVMQLVAVVQNPSLASASIISTGQGPLASFLNGIRQRLWLIWPSYVVVVLMAIGYWLGEREEYQQLVGRKRALAPARVHKKNPRMR
ncbi:MAG TPA: Ig-like domain-containing protein [Candidatus Saccharimonadales bacterium]|nr:Ig-like domain-containing protein [Candidatus Saccharimonadales bacterium]